MDIIEISYRFKLDQHRQEIIDLRLDAQNLEIINKTGRKLPPWTKLDFLKCPHCPLNSGSHPECPIAVSLIDVVERFDSVLSCDEIDLEVFAPDRKVSQRTTAQRGISSLLGFLFPTSGCPHTAFFKPMVRFHLPMATAEDTIFRATGMYLLAQYFRLKEGQAGDFDFRGLTKIYNNLHLLNIHVAKRLRLSVEAESPINAIVLLDVFTHALPMFIEDNLEEIRHLFTPYFSEFYDSCIRDESRTGGSGRK